MALYSFPADANTEQYAQALDAKDPLAKLREQFIIPSRNDLKNKKLAKPDSSSSAPSIYFCGNSLGLQPKATAKYLQAHLDTWASIGVQGHFTDLEESPLKNWQHMAAVAATSMAKIVGASPAEVTTMGGLTIDLHLLMGSFYKPTATRSKIIFEKKAFPSDHYMFESQCRLHGLDPKDTMVLLEPDNGEYTISTSKILAAIDAHADDAALILLPGIQFYSGQFFDIETITKHAQSKGLIVGWDLAHAAGNVPLKLHEWNVDFAAWCTYKYMNAGPGAIGGVFVHERHGVVDCSQGEDQPIFRSRLAGWYGGDRNSRFNMDNKFRPEDGAAGYQVSNPSVVDMASLTAALTVFDQTSMAEIREKSLQITGYLEHLLLEGSTEVSSLFQIITPSDPTARGTQLSILLKPGLLETVFATLTNDGFLFDQRKPDVIRIAPVPLYNTYTEVLKFVTAFKAALASTTK